MARPVPLHEVTPGIERFCSQLKCQAHQDHQAIEHLTHNCGRLLFQKDILSLATRMSTPFTPCTRSAQRAFLAR